MDHRSPAPRRARAPRRAATLLAVLSAAASTPAALSGQARPGDGATPTRAAAASGASGANVDLLARARTNGLRVVGTAATALDDGSYRGVRLADRGSYRGQVIAWLDDVAIGDGVIELDIRGKDVFQQSFPGVAFRAASDSAFEVVYLRPFNFHAADTLRRQHAVQYMALPDYDFDRLRQERPEEFENPVVPPPDPNGWVHLRVVLAGPRVSVFVGEGAEPDLVVEAIGRRAPGRVGLYNPGDYANLRVTPAAAR
jgi:hypothetical protein